MIQENEIKENTTDEKKSHDVIIYGKPYQPIPRKPHSTLSACGSPTIIRADLGFGANGEKIAKPGQKLDLDAMIQAAIPTTDIASIVARAKMGDESVLHLNPGFTGDAAALPRDLYDYKRMNDLYDKVSASFDSLPAEIKALFNNKADDYLNSIIANKAEKIIADFKASQEAKPNEETK